MNNIDVRATLKRQTVLTSFAMSVILCTTLGSTAQAKGLFGSEDKDANSPQTLQAQLYQIQQQLTQLQAQMTQLQLQMNKRTTVIEQKQNSLHETLTAQAAMLKTLAKEEQQIEHQVAQVQRHTEPVAKAPAPTRAQQPTLEESADYEVAHVNTKASPSYKSHIQDLEPAEQAAPVKKPVAIATKPMTPNTVTEAKAEAKTETKKEKKERKEKEASKAESKSAEEKSEAKTSRLLPGIFGDKISKTKKESAAQPETPVHQAAQSTQAEAPKPSLNSGKARVKASIVIKAPPEVVFNAVHEQRKVDPELAYSKVMKQGVNEAQLEQKFTAIPMIGSATCLINTQEVPNRRIDYQMIKSDKFKSMEGSWVLTPSADGKSTTLELSSHIDTGLPVPRMMMNGITKQKMERRLSHVRELAEKSRLAQRSGSGAQ